ncbi:hypothetical protein A3I53_00615 [Candidatus Curtissbacteria bacterium RIFCSPLOWO2_02_FULL_40_13b]|uniref:Uncharacterized protein n=1 Tax=Candidatus Curtissbacteria bacterium RIFCSPLOWO2_02_FULL_40_13b TaxID=1797733 RepID=A0A1F5HPZ1_9BACT|nr:MAG: hypothetical protein A3I53_00615 [Candidatus Curtissbacteria bacterium RIFCSPLOWO2_02_FULL_40_13b]
MFRPIGSLLKEIPIRSRSPKAIVALQVRNAALESLALVCSDLPKEIIETIKPSIFKAGVLTVTAPQMVTGELQMRSGGLIREINKVLGKQIVKSLRFRVL